MKLILGVLAAFFMFLMVGCSSESDNDKDQQNRAYKTFLNGVEVMGTFKAEKLGKFAKYLESLDIRPGVTSKDGITETIVIGEGVYVSVDSDSEADLECRVTAGLRAFGEYLKLTQVGAEISATKETVDEKAFSANGEQLPIFTTSGVKSYSYSASAIISQRIIDGEVVDRSVEKIDLILDDGASCAYGRTGEDKAASWECDVKTMGELFNNVNFSPEAISISSLSMEMDDGYCRSAFIFRTPN